MDLPLIEYVATQSQIRLFFRATLSSDFLYIAALQRRLCNASPLFLIYTGLLSMYMTVMTIDKHITGLTILVHNIITRQVLVAEGLK